MKINKLFGNSFGDAKSKPVDFSGSDVMVFDEICLSNWKTFWRIKQFVEQKTTEQNKYGNRCK